jgi:hypothetical protein
MINLKIILTLTILSVTLTVALFGFLIINKNKFNVTLEGKPVPNFFCATPSLSNDIKIEKDIVSQGKILFESNCKACHRLDKKLVGPALRDTQDVIPLGLEK